MEELAVRLVTLARGVAAAPWPCGEEERRGWAARLGLPVVGTELSACPGRPADSSAFTARWAAGEVFWSIQHGVMRSMRIRNTIQNLEDLVTHHEVAEHIGPFSTATGPWLTVWTFRAG